MNFPLVPSPIMSINRNIVECKVACESLKMRLTVCINRNIVECKVVYVKFDGIADEVLIET